MNFDELAEITCSVIKDDDSFKASKQRQIQNWCSSFLEIFSSSGKGKLQFVLDVLTDEECWKKTDSIHGIKLDRRAAAKKMIQQLSWKGTSNPLDDFHRYQIACWCCLEEDIIIMFDHFKRENKINESDSNELRILIKSLSGICYTDALMQFWSHFVSGNLKELDTKGENPYVFGLYCTTIKMRRKYVEALEFFWNKIKLLPENEISVQEREELFMTVAVDAANDSDFPEIFEFCLYQLRPNNYSELLKRDLEKNTYYASLYRTLETSNFDQFQVLFDCLNPSDVQENYYCTWLRSIKIESCSGQYLKAGVKLLMHMLTKDGFHNHCATILNEEMKYSSLQGRLLIPLIEKGCFETVRFIINKASPAQIREFMSSRKANYIQCILKHCEENLLEKILSFVEPSLNFDEERK